VKGLVKCGTCVCGL